MHIRQAVEDDLDRIVSCRVTDPISHVTEQKYRELLATRAYRPEWTWIAEDRGLILARAVCWGFPQEGLPRELDCLYVEPTVKAPVLLCAQLVSEIVRVTNPAGFAYHLRLSPDWRSDATIARAVAWRLAAAARAGLGEITERSRYEWTPETALPPRSQRVVFVPCPDDEAFIDAFRRVSVGSLDAHTRRQVAAVGSEQAARQELASYSMMMGSRDWWRLAYTKSGELIGFALPEANDGGPVVGYLGVVPEHRGRGFIDDLLAEITLFLAERGAQRIVADVDTANTPMVAAFVRARYRCFAERVVASQGPGRG